MAYKDVLLLGVISTASQEATHERRERLKAYPNFLRRTVVTALNELAIHHPEPIANWLGVDLRNTTRNFIGRGADSIVFRNGSDFVAKLHIGSFGITPEQQDAMARARQTNYYALASHLSKFVLPQTTVVGSHPFTNNRNVVITQQPFRTITDTRLFAPFQSAVDKRALATMAEHHPKASDSLPSFIEASFNLYDTAGLVPDTGGAANLVIDTDNSNLLLIDAQPTLKCDRSGQRLVLAQLESLAKALEPIA